MRPINAKRADLGMSRVSARLAVLLFISSSHRANNLNQREFGLSGLLTGVVFPLSRIGCNVHVNTQDSTTIPGVNQDRLILSLAINWKSKRGLNIESPKPVELLPLYPEQSVPSAV